MTDDRHRNDLGDFLKARRGELRPAAVGLPEGSPRRVPGLRREEVAVLAAISTDYYTRLEQGRIQASPSVVESLARVLQLDEDQRAYLYELAARVDFRPPRRQPRTTVAPQLQRMLDDMPHTPAFVIGPRTEIVAWNAMGAALITDFAQIAKKDRYYIRLLITDPAMRELYADWEGVTRLAIAILAGAVLPAIRDDGHVAFFLANTVEPDRGITAFRSYVMRSATRHDAIDKLARAVEAGQLSTRVAETYPAFDAAAAHHRLEQGKLRGRLMLEF